MDIHDSRGNLAYRVADKEFSRLRAEADRLELMVSAKALHIYSDPTVRRSAKLLRRMGLITRKQYLKRIRRARKRFQLRYSYASFEQAIGRTDRTVPPMKVTYHE
jgi:hypothetical protein